MNTLLVQNRFDTPFACPFLFSDTITITADIAINFCFHLQFFFLFCYWPKPMNTNKYSTQRLIVFDCITTILSQKYWFN